MQFSLAFSKDLFLLKLKDCLTNVRTKKSDIFYGWKVSVSESRSLQSLMLGDPYHGLASYQEREAHDRAYEIEVFTRSGAR